MRPGSGRTAVVAGTISSAAFAGGHRFVVGHWPTSPLGPLADVMWTDPDDRRTLVVASPSGAEFIGSIYEFDEVSIEPLRVEWYQTWGWRWVSSGSAQVDGVNLGGPQRFERPVGVGFSEPPPRPSIVAVRVTIELPPARTDQRPE